MPHRIFGERAISRYTGNRVVEEGKRAIIDREVCSARQIDVGVVRTRRDETRRPRVETRERPKDNGGRGRGTTTNPGFEEIRDFSSFRGDPLLPPSLSVYFFPLRFICVSFQTASVFDRLLLAYGIAG